MADDKDKRVVDLNDMNFRNRDVMKWSDQIRAVKPSTTASQTSASERQPTALLFQESKGGNGKQRQVEEGQQDLSGRHCLGEAYL